MVELLISSTGLVAASYQYDPWGNPLSATGPAANVSPFRWQGEFYDASFGGYSMGAREGSARSHIFLSPDPSGEASDPNLYRMVGNDPINDVDPTGLTQQQALDYFKSLPADVQDNVAAIIKLGFDGQLPGNTGYSLSAADEPYRQYIDQAINLNNQAYDLGAFFQSNPTLRGLADAGTLIDIGHSLAPTDRISAPPFAVGLVPYVAFGQSQAAVPLRRYVGGYTDEFGTHVSFCMSCHDWSDPGAQLKMLAAINATNNSPTVFLLQNTLPLLLGPFAEGAAEALQVAEMAGEEAAASTAALSYVGEQAAGSTEAGSIAARQARVAARSLDDEIDRQLRADALRIWRQFPAPYARNGTTVATGIFNGQRVYAVSNNTTSAAVREMAEKLGYTRISGKIFTAANQTDAEQILLNWAGQSGFLAEDAGAVIAPSRIPCGLSASIRQNCWGRIATTPGVRLIGPWASN